MERRGSDGLEAQVMSRGRITITWTAFLATFTWLLLADVKDGPAALWPSVLAVGLAFVTRDIYASLFLGAFAGAILLREGNVFGAFLDLFSKYLIPALKDPWNVSVLVFTLLMGGFVELLNCNGGMAALAAKVLGKTHSRRRAALGVYWMGWVVFIDGLANSLLIGKAMRPITDRAGVSREKLSFIVDSTSSPIAGLALISTWVAYEMSVIKQGLEMAGASALAPFQLLVLSLPFRFYNWFLLLLVFLVIWLGRDFGPMLAAERKARSSAGEANGTTPANGGSLWLAVVPLTILVLGVFGGLFVQGGGLDQPLTMASAIDAFGKADAALVFVWATAFAVVVTLAMSARSTAEAMKPGGVRIFFEGMRQLFLPALILVFAWVLNGVIKDIGAAKFLVSFLGGNLPGALLPALVFLLAALVSFSTGTSWGTMALVMPLAVPVAVKLGGNGASVVLIATIGAVLAGAVFGDHCSPISDTTIVSAFSSDCDAMDHVRTQLPYAMAAAGVAVVLGYGPAGFKVSPYVLLAIGGAACWALLRYRGKPIDGAGE
ncbi:MAG: Na+/H+ antiporter NhaC family protein [Verrucomicrobiota bacterium]